MTDYLTAFFTNTNVLSIIVAITINIVWLALISVKRRWIPTKLFLLNFFLWLGLFINAGMTDESYAMIYILAVAGLVTYIYARQFAEGAAGTQKIFLSYCVFFAVAFLLEGMAVSTSDVLDTELPIKSANAMACQLGDSVWSAIPAILTCMYNYLSYLFGMFGFASSVTALNTILIVPFIFFMIFMIVERLHP